jgi:prolyl oligopeptidase
VVTPEERWPAFNGGVSAGSLVIVPLDELTGGGAVSGDVLFTPGARQSVEEVAVTDDRITATIYDNVRGGLRVFERGQSRWHEQTLPVPENVSVHLGDSSKKTNRVFYSVEGFLTPSTLSLADIDAGSAEVIKSAPARFDASTHVVEQFEATSSDGTKIPYFVVRPRDLVMDGHAPTIIYGYGGFQVSKPPAYIPEMGKLWLENGGVYVNANIRGGGEFGPDWHQSVLKENRQLAFDDYAAVARDLQARGITSPRRTGIYGRSNGGVLTSVAVTQHPELLHAAVIESPLIDMLRYHELPAGASWIGEYGDPRIPEEAAFIARYSAYQNLRPDADYPRVYITTNTRDDRVHPGHARKFAARLGDMGYDHLYYEETSGGHSNDADPVANARRWARHYVYLAQQLMD